MFDTPPLILIKILFAYLEVVPHALEAFMDGEGGGAKKKNPMGLSLFIFSGVWAMDALVLHPPPISLVRH